VPGREDIHEEQARRARADLDRMSRPGDMDAGSDDPIEKWGKLIGRGLGLVFLVYLVYWLSTKLL
jgi:hypothetical protein